MRIPNIEPPEQPTARGMTLRDWFAGQALAGYMAQTVVTGEDASTVAGWCYEQADAMLAAREE